MTISKEISEMNHTHTDIIGAAAILVDALNRSIAIPAGCSVIGLFGAG